ncbi:MAG: DUF362 domain-containing protein [Clostridia bacterium]|nr:DUF362 domain-containing protein [Clostridia bacterium]
MANSKYYSPTDPVSILPLGEYDPSAAKETISELLAPLGGLDFVRAGMRIVIKANLVSAMAPDTAATTHHVLLSALTELLVERGATVVIGDSPGGLYNAAFVGKVYRASGVTECEAHGATLNRDFGEKTAVFEDAAVLHSFTYTSYLDGADCIINFCKLKSHGMMGMSCAAKNMFGTIPGIIKPEYHYRFPKYSDFANMLLDLDEYFHPILSIADAVVGMEGNGPTAGTPRKIGCLIASHSPHTLDMLAARIIGLDPAGVPTVAAAMERGLVPSSLDGLNVFGKAESFYLSDFETVTEKRSLEFTGSGKNPIKRLFGKIAGAILKTRPVLKKDLCVGCGVCKNICPAKAITIKDKKAVIDRSLCIRCFCCQEFCPKSAMKVRRTALGSIFHRERKEK